MSIERLSADALERASGPAWGPLRQAFLDISEILLSVSPETVGVLTTIYVKYQVTSAAMSPVFAVVWLKTSKEIVVGLTLPDDFRAPLLGPPPPRHRYGGLTKYFIVKPGDSAPTDLFQWAKAAYQHATETQE